MQISIISCRQILFSIPARRESGFTENRCSLQSRDVSRFTENQKGTSALLTILLSLLTAISSCGGESGRAGLFEAGVLYCKAETAILRTDPTTYGFEIDTIRKGESVKVLRRTDKKSRIGRTEDYWYFVEKENHLKGWVYGAALSLIPTGEAEEVVDAPDLVVVQANLPGIWWEVNADGSTGYRRLEFIPAGAEEKKKEKEAKKTGNSLPRSEQEQAVILAENGKFQYFYGRTPGVILEYRIDPKTRRIILNQDSPVGQQFEIIDLGEEFRMTSAKGDKKFTFKKGFETGDEENAEEKSERPQS
jgi:uncharacterized protein YgiM (DUF1202 family)